MQAIRRVVLRTGRKAHVDSPHSDSTSGVEIETIQVRYNDLDTLGHVNSVAYFSFLETARWGFFRGLGFVPDDAFVVARTECDYIAEIPASARQITVETWAMAVGRTSMTLGHRIMYADRLRARAVAVMVRIDESQWPRPLTEAERYALGRYPGAPGTDGVPNPSGGAPLPDSSRA